MWGGSPWADRPWGDGPASGGSTQTLTASLFSNSQTFYAATVQLTGIPTLSAATVTAITATTARPRVTITF